jgi:hypothetical protein
MGSATKKQIEIAKKLGIDVSADSSIIAAAKIESAVYEAINPGVEPRKATEKQIDFLKALNIETEYRDHIIVSALIDEELRRRNVEAITKLDLKAGDTIVSEQYGLEQENVISSIGVNHRIWFKGGQGRGCWPSKVIRKIQS